MRRLAPQLDLVGLASSVMNGAMADLRIIDTPSPNYDDRTAPITMLVLHYTGMQSCDAAIARLTQAASKVSSHYVVAEDGQVLRLVAEDKRAWHAGQSWWRGTTDINSASIGIEICNPGHEFGYRPFPEAQIDALIPLVGDIVGRYGITRGNIVGHSDIAPARKAGSWGAIPLEPARKAAPCPAAADQESG